MKTNHNIITTLLIFMVITGAVHGENNHEPFARVSIEPTNAIAGQQVTVTVEVLAPNWFTRSPAFPDIEVDNAITLLMGHSFNFSEKVGGMTYAGQKRNYSVYPLKAGTYKVQPIHITLSYAIKPPESSPPVTVSTRFQQFEATVPEEIANLEYFITTSDFSLEHTVSRNISNLKVGDSFTRSITMNAKEVVSMVLPPLNFEHIHGIAIYPDQPVLDDKGGVRGEIKTGTRTESATYVLEKAGDYVLPGINVLWWDIKKGKLQKATVPAITIAAKFNHELETEQLALLSSDEDQNHTASAGRILNWWYLAALVSLIASIISLIMFWKKYRLLCINWINYRKAQKANSEAAYFKRFHKACLSGDKKETFNQLMSWLDKIYNKPGSATILWFVNLTENLEIEEQVYRLTGSLFADDKEMSFPYPLSDFYKCINKARKVFLHKKRRSLLHHTGIASLNP